MVSSGTVSSDAGSANSLLTSFSSQISGIGSSWQGSSSDNLKSKVEEFVSSASSIIESEMSAFASAITSYEKYKQVKQQMQQAEANYNFAVSQEANNPNYSGTSSSVYSKKVSECQQQMNSLKSEIESYLQTAASGKIDVSANRVNVSSSVSSSLSSHGDFVNYYQGDYKQSYGYGTTISSGCGPTSMAMVLTALTGKEITPVDAANYSLNHGYRIQDNGTSWSYFDSISNNYGLNCEQTGVSSDKFRKTLNNNGYVILSMSPGHFTKRGHFIVATGIDSNRNVTVADPASRERSSHTWSESTVLGEAKQMWSVTV